jgi:4-carboxymuconolactone decarboxylase
MTSELRALDVVSTVAPKLAELTEDVLFADVWERKDLSKRDRSLITLASFISLNRTDQLRIHFRRAVVNGVTEREISEVITHLAFYAGWPCAMTAGVTAREIFDEVGP